MNPCNHPTASPTGSWTVLPIDTAIDPAMAERTLNAVGLRLGEPIRFRRNDGGRWIEGRVARMEPDGSVTLHDPDGAARSLRPERVQVRRPGSRGRLAWQTVSDVAVTWEQLDLFEG